MDFEKSGKLFKALFRKFLTASGTILHGKKAFKEFANGVAKRMEVSLSCGRLLFPTEEEEDIGERVGGYKTYFGPTFYGGFVCYAKESLVNLEKALTRLTCQRETDTPGLHDELCKNQDGAFEEGSWFWEVASKYFNWLRKNCLRSLSIDLGEVIDTIIKDASRPHPKLRLRLEAMREILERGILYSMEYMQFVIGKTKCPEWAKPGKFPRMIGDFTCPGSLLGGALMACLKTCFTDWYDLEPHFKMVFVYSANYERLRECFEELLSNIGKSVFVYHSDDMCCNLNCVDGRARFNVDIKSCDSSNGQKIFDMLLWLVTDTVWYDVMWYCVEQCLKSFQLKNPRNPKEVLYLGCRRPFEFSGTTLTTLLNNIAMSAICLAIANKCKDGITKAEAKGVVEQAAKSIGYLVSIEDVSCDEDFQFLKTSPTRTHGVVGVFLNLGVILRSLGTCDGDLPGRGSIESRAEKRNSDIVAGMCHAGSSIIMNALRVRFPSQGDAIHSHYVVENMSGFEDTVVSIDALCRRYCLADVQFEYLAHEITDSKIGDVIANDALRAIFKKDYGM